MRKGSANCIQTNGTPGRPASKPVHPMAAIQSSTFLLLGGDVGLKNESAVKGRGADWGGCFQNSLTAKKYVEKKGGKDLYALYLTERDEIFRGPIDAPPSNTGPTPTRATE